MEELGREGFDPRVIGDADCILIDESHNFRNNKSNRYLALDEAIQRNGGRGRDGERKKLILLSATPINNDLYDLASQISLFTQSEADYFPRRRHRRRECLLPPGAAQAAVDARRRGRAVQSAGRDHGAEHAAIYPGGLSERDDQRQTRRFSRAAAAHGRTTTWARRAAACIRKSWPRSSGCRWPPINSNLPQEIGDSRRAGAQWEAGREVALVGIFKTRFLKRLESSVFAFRESLRRCVGVRGDLSRLFVRWHGRLFARFSKADALSGARRRRRSRGRQASPKIWTRWKRRANI